MISQKELQRLYFFRNGDVNLLQETIERFWVLAAGNMRRTKNEQKVVKFFFRNLFFFMLETKL